MRRLTVGLFAFLFVLVFPRTGLSDAGAVTVEPGETVSFDNPDNCFTKEVDDCGTLCDASFDCVGSFYRIDLLADVSGIEKGSAEGWTSSEFTVSGSEEVDISASVRAKARWSGLLIVQAAFNAEVSIRGEFQLYDKTANRLVDSQIFLDEKCGKSTLLTAFDCNEDITGDEELALSVTVTRGHTYEIRLRAKAVAKVIVGVGARVDFEAGGFIQLQRLEPDGPFIELRLARDPFAEIDVLERRVNSLETILDQLLSEFAAHAHVYKTGPGTGHNNLDARTTPPEESSELAGQSLLHDSVDQGDRPAEGSMGPAEDEWKLNFVNPMDVRDGVPVSVMQTPGLVTVRYRIDGAEAPVQIAVYDVSGRLIRTLESGSRQNGEHMINWDLRDEAGRRASRGIYLLRSIVGPSTSTKKIVIAE